MGRSRRLAAAVAALVAAGCGLVAAPAQATGLPRLLSVSVSANQVTVPGQVTVSYTASSDSAITYADATYGSPDGRTHRVDLTAGTAGSGTLSAPDGVANGAWTLEQVGLYDNSGSLALICAPGSSNPGNRCTSFTDFSAETITVSGSIPDYNAPLISSLSVTPGPVQPGGNMTIAWADDEIHTDALIYLTFQNFDPRAQGDTVQVGTELPADVSARQFSVPVKQFAYNGVYQLTSLVIADNVGNQATYLPDGKTQLTVGTVSPTSHMLNFSAIKFTVTGSTQGLNPPQLNLLHVTAPTSPNGGPIKVAYIASGATQPVTLRSLTFLTPDGAKTVSGGDSLPASVSFGTSSFGTYQLSEIELQDGRGDLLVYRRDGTTYNPITGAVGSHTINFPQFDMTIEPPLVEVLGVWPGPNAATIRWSIPHGSGVVATQTRITVNPGGRTILVPSDPVGHPIQQYTIPGLRNGVYYNIGIGAVGAPPGNVSGTRTWWAVTPMMSDRIFSPGDLNGDGRDDLMAYNPATDSSTWFYRRAGVSYGARSLSESLPQTERVIPAGDTNHDGKPDLFVVDSDGTLELHGGQLNGTPSPWVQRFGRGWDGVRFMAGGFDFTGDGVPDLYAVNGSGFLCLYPLQFKNSTVLIPTTRTLGGGWNDMRSVFSPGDFNGDHKADLMAVDGTGTLWLYPGDGHGGFGSRVQIGSGWGGFGAVFALRNFSGNGHMDIGAVDMSGHLYRYAGTGTGRFLPGRTLIGTGWSSYF